jgi:tetratricopeptide (TPR) repeat protein
MLFRSKDLQKKVGKLVGAAVGTKDPAIFRQVLDLDPHCGTAYLGLGNIAMTAGRIEEAEKYYWDGLAQQPCSYVFYFALAQLGKNRNEELSRDLTMLAFRKLSQAGEASPKLVGLLNETMGQAAGLDFSNPATFKLVANIMGSIDRENLADPRLRPYLLLDRLQDDMTEELLGEIRSSPPEMAPVLESVLREWANDKDAIDEPALCLSVALLGEIGPVSALENLLDVSTTAIPALFPPRQLGDLQDGSTIPRRNPRPISRQDSLRFSGPALRHRRAVELHAGESGCGFRGAPVARRLP